MIGTRNKSTHLNHARGRSRKQSMNPVPLPTKSCRTSPPPRPPRRTVTTPSPPPLSLLSRPLRRQVAMMSPPPSQPVGDKEPVWQVNMTTVIVMFFTILSFLYKSSTHRVPNLSTESYKPVLPMFEKHRPSLSPTLLPSPANPGLLAAPDEMFWPCSSSTRQCVL